MERPNGKNRYHIGPLHPDEKLWADQKVRVHEKLRATALRDTGERD